MMRKPRGRLEQLIPELRAWFDEHKPAVYDANDLVTLLDRKRDEWAIPAYIHGGRFIDFLIERVGLKEIEAVSVGERRLPQVKRFTWGDVNHLVLAATFRRESYLSHGTAVFVHGLNDQNPLVLFNSKSQLLYGRAEANFSQVAIDRAFSKPQRESHRVYQAIGHRFSLLDSICRDNDIIQAFIGKARIRVSSVERTLLDIAVRPRYAGGIIQVLEAYRRASINVHKLFNVLKHAGYKYPYQQALGFYLQRAGVSNEDLEPFREAISKYNFYLAHALVESDYIPEWKLYVPRGLK